jgi:Lar family restriction alleviation protein
MAESKLKPCPFCGSSDVGHQVIPDAKQFVMCNGCGACIDSIDAQTDDVCSLWNRRSPDPEAQRLEAEVQRLREALEKIDAMDSEYVIATEAPHIARAALKEEKG